MNLYDQPGTNDDCAGILNIQYADVKSDMLLDEQKCYAVLSNDIVSGISMHYDSSKRCQEIKCM